MAVLLPRTDLIVLPESKTPSILTTLSKLLPSLKPSLATTAVAVEDNCCIFSPAKNVPLIFLKTNVVGDLYDPNKEVSLLYPRPGSLILTFCGIPILVDSR